MLLALLQILTLIVWSITLIVTASGTFRMLFSSPRFGDTMKSAFFFIAIVLIMKSAGRLFVPHSNLTWFCVYGLAALSGIYVWVVLYNLKRDYAKYRCIRRDKLESEL